MRNGSGTKFTIDRKLFSSDIWFASPWKLKIWLYLVGNANHSDGEWMGIKLKRGQLIRSYRTIQNDCSYNVGYRTKKPSLHTICRICEDLTKELRIERRSEHGGQVITILNYNELQPLKKDEGNGEANDRGTIGEHNKNVNKKYSQNSNEFRLANFLFSHIKRNNPKAKEPNIQSWAGDFDKILRIDKRPVEEVKSVISWSQKDEFWFQNILSATKLRKQYDQLLLKMGALKPVKEIETIALPGDE